jgi:hypothetical protein
LVKRADKKFKKRLSLKQDRLLMIEACLCATLRFEGKTEEDINYGDCFNWAEIVFDLMPGSKIVWQSLNQCWHTWIEYKGLCYDAEVPKGIRNWLNLPFWERLKAEAGTRDFNRALKKALLNCDLSALPVLSYLNPTKRRNHGT